MSVWPCQKGPEVLEFLLLEQSTVGDEVGYVGLHLVPIQKLLSLFSFLGIIVRHF